MALFYKYAKILNDFHTLQREGRKDEAQALITPLTSENISDEEQKQLKKAQEQLVVYSSYIEKELQKPEYGTDNINSLLFSMGLGTPEQIETYNKAFDACIARYNISEPLAKRDDTSEDALVPACLSKSLSHYTIPIDKVSLSLWDPTELLKIKKDGQLVFTGEDAAITCALWDTETSEDISLSKNITKKQELIHDIIGSYWLKYEETGNANYRILSLTQLYKAMGYKGTPNSTTLQNLAKEVNTIRHVDITLDNVNVRNDNGENISELKKYNVPHINYTGRLLPVDFIEISFKGKVTDKAIIIKECPIITKMAKGRNQYITVNADLFEIDPKKISLTESTIAIRYYLWREIGLMKHKPKKGDNQTFKRDNHIRIDTLKRKCGIKEKNKDRLEKKIFYFLDLFKRKGYIKDYNYSTNGEAIEIIY